MLGMNPFMKQLIQPSPGKQAAEQQPQQPPQYTVGDFFLPQQPQVLPGLQIPPLSFGAADEPPIPIQPPPEGMSAADRLRAMDPRQRGDWMIDPTNPEQFLQYNRKF